MTFSKAHSDFFKLFCPADSPNNAQPEVSVNRSIYLSTNITNNEHESATTMFIIHKFNKGQTVWAMCQMHVKTKERKLAEAGFQPFSPRSKLLHLLIHTLAYFTQSPFMLKCWNSTCVILHSRGNCRQKGNTTSLIWNWIWIFLKWHGKDLDA